MSKCYTYERMQRKGVYLPLKRTDVQYTEERIKARGNLPNRVHIINY